MYKLTGLAGALFALAAAAHRADAVHRRAAPAGGRKSRVRNGGKPQRRAGAARIGGTVVDLSVRDGDEVKQGQQLAIVGDEKLLLQIHALDAQIEGLQAQLAQGADRFQARRYAGAHRRRARASSSTRHAPRWTWPAARWPPARPNATWWSQQMREGAVLAPTAGRVLRCR